ncbi:hypothetical protein J7L01_03755 [bacterium]|nr:hypothetical protein [bacterium]
MKRFVLVMFILAASVMLIVGCSKSTEPEPEPEVFDPPTGLAYATYQDSIALSWNASPDASEDGFVGYLVYRRENAGFSGLSEDDLAALSPVAVAGITATSTGLASDKKHYFAVRAMKIVGAETTMTSLSNTVDTSPTIWFSDTIWESAGGDSVICAIDFDNQVVYPMELAHLTHIDIYLGVDDSNRLALKSPSTFGTDWSDREAEIKRLGVATSGLASFTTAGSGGWTDEVTLYPGEAYAIHIGSHYTKILVENWIGGAYPGRGITFSAAHQDVEDYDHF